MKKPTTNFGFPPVDRHRSFLPETASRDTASFPPFPVACRHLRRRCAMWYNLRHGKVRKRFGNR